MSRKDSTAPLGLDTRLPPPELEGRPAAARLLSLAVIIILSSLMDGGGI